MWSELKEKWTRAADRLRYDSRFRLARVWSNRELKKIAPLCLGEICNVSAWRDEDKQGGHYRDYFPNASGYHVTNIPGDRGATGVASEIICDLEAPLPENLRARFDAVFNHTALEHIFEVFTAFANLCAMSRDLVIVVVPFMQEEHPAETYGDFWRFSHQALEKLFAANGLAVVYRSSSPYTFGALYYFYAASRNPERWRGKMPPSPENLYTGAGHFRDPFLLRKWRESS